LQVGGDDTAAEASWYKAAKERKVTLSSGVEVFQRNPVKGLRVLQAAGMVSGRLGKSRGFWRRQKKHKHH
jgi:hypothetical protein